MVKNVDVRDLACPGPVLKLRDLLGAGEREITMHVADELSRSNVSRFAASRGAEVEVTDGGGGSFVVAIRAGGDAAVERPGDEELLACDVPEAVAVVGPRVVQITAGTMGSGDDELFIPSPDSGARPARYALYPCASSSNSTALDQPSATM